MDVDAVENDVVLVSSVAVRKDVHRVAYGGLGAGETVDEAAQAVDLGGWVLGREVEGSHRGASSSLASPVRKNGSEAANCHSPPRGTKTS